MKRTTVWPSLMMVILATVSCSDNGVTDPRSALIGTSSPADSVRLAEGVTAALFMEDTEIAVGDTLMVALRVQNHRREPVDVISTQEPMAAVLTEFDGESVTLVGGTNPVLPRVATYTISPGDDHVQSWQLVAERYHPKGDLPSIGRYDLTVRLIVQVDERGDEWDRVDLEDTFVIRE